jgi:hypothetical protein
VWAPENSWCYLTVETRGKTKLSIKPIFPNVIVHAKVENHEMDRDEAMQILKQMLKET